MDSSIDIAQSLLKLGAAAIFSSNSMALDPVEFQLASRDFRGLAVSTVGEVDLHERDTLPLVLASQFSAVRDWETPLADNLAVLMFDHSTGSLAAAKPFDDRSANRPDSGRPIVKRPRPTGDAATGVSTSVRRVDMRKLFGLAWRNGRLSFIALSFDTVSNVADVSLVGGAAAALPTPRKVMPEPRVDGPGLPSYDPSAGVSPPHVPGIAFSVTVNTGASGAVVRGALSTPALERHLLKTLASVGDRPVAAVIPVSFIVAGRGWKVPWVFEWGVPLLGRQAPVVGSPAAASFAIPIPDDKFRLLAPGEYAAYMVMEGRVFGPQRFTVPVAVR